MSPSLIDPFPLPPLTNPRSLLDFEVWTEFLFSAIQEMRVNLRN